MADLMRSSGIWTPITPVDETCIASSGIPNPSATIWDVSRAAVIPCAPVQALALPLFTSSAWDFPLLMRSMERSTGAALTVLRVKTAQVVAGFSEKIRARSLRPGFFMAASTVAN